MKRPHFTRSIHDPLPIVMEMALVTLKVCTSIAIVQTNSNNPFRSGIISKLHHLKDIGVTSTWLSPIFKSPMADFGYDISDFFDIDPTFGTMADVVELFRQANEMDIKIILDFVPNHSSIECEWFIKSVARDPEYVDYYVWHDGYLVDGVRRPPNNWVILIEWFCVCFGINSKVNIPEFSILWIGMDMERTTSTILSASICQRATRPEFPQSKGGANNEGCFNVLVGPRSRRISH